MNDAEPTNPAGSDSGGAIVGAILGIAFGFAPPFFAAWQLLVWLMEGPPRPFLFFVVFFAGRVGGMAGAVVGGAFGYGVFRRAFAATPRAALALRERGSYRHGRDRRMLHGVLVHAFVPNQRRRQIRAALPKSARVH